LKKKYSRKKKGTKSIKRYFWFILLLAGFFYCINIWVLEPRSSIAIKKELIKNQPKGFVGFGIDISHHQGEIEWEDLLSNFGFDTIIQFVYIKATEGKDYLDPLFRINQQALNKYGLKNGVYHFYQPNSDPIHQMEWFLSNYMYHPTDLPPVLDVEVYSSKDVEFLKNLKLALVFLEEKTGVRPIVYTSYNLYKHLFINDLKDYKFWIAAYSKMPEHIEDSRIIHWQYTDKGKLPGINGHVDFNVSKMKFYH
jgi:lysozyme